jgi:hypothetical protein
MTSRSGRIDIDRPAIRRALPGTHGSDRSAIGAAAPRRSGSPGARRSRAHQSPAPEQLGHLGHQILCLRVADGLPGHQHDVVPILDPGRDLAPGGPQDPSRSIALDGAAHAACRDHGGEAGAGRDTQYHPVSAQVVPLCEHPADVTGAHRELRRRGELGPCGVGAPRLHGPPACASGGGTRASSRGAGCSVGTFVCPWPWRWVLSARRPAHAGRDRQVYGGATSLDKGLDNEKSVKTPDHVSTGQNRGAIVRPASPRAARSPAGGPRRHLPPEVFSTVVERLCGFAWRQLSLSAMRAKPGHTS